MIKIIAEYEVKVLDPKTGEVIRSVKGESKSFTLNFGRLIAILFQRGDYQVSVPVVDTSGASRTFRNNDTTSSPFEVSTSTANRIRLHIGSSNEPFSRGQYEMLGKIAEFDYSTYNLADDGTKIVVQFSGSWLNTGSLVTVREIGFDVVYNAAGTVTRFLLTRDVIPDTTVDTNQTIAVGYTITIPY